MPQAESLSAVVISEASSCPLNSARLIPVALIAPNPFQPRLPLTDDDIFELSRNIQRVGVLEPLLVRQLPRVGRISESDNRRVGWAAEPDLSVGQVSKPVDTSPVQIPAPKAQSPIYQLISGHRRLAASIKAGLTEVPCIIRDADDIEILELALIENLQRQNLTPIEEAEGYRSFIKMTGMTQQQVAGKVNKSEAIVSQRLALLELPVYIQEAVALKKLAIHKALEIGRLGGIHPERSEGSVSGENRRGTPRNNPVQERLVARADRMSIEQLRATVQKALDKRRVGRKRYEKRSPDPLFKDIFKDLPVKRVYKDTVTFVFKEEEELIRAMKTAIERWESDASLRGTQ